MRPRSGLRAPRRPVVLIAVGLSVAVHLAAALVIIVLPRVMPHEAGPGQQGTVELLMVEAKGARPSEPGQPRDSQPAPTQPEKKPEPPKHEAAEPQTQAKASLPRVTESGATESGPENGPPPREETPAKQAKADPQPDAHALPTPPPQPKAQEAPVFDLAGTESESNAEVLGSGVVPASPDNRFRNRPPIYPDEAAIQGEHGSVLLLIHVSEAGSATGAEVMESSGVASLDQAAVTAVLKWRFRPALQEGRAVPFDMPFRFVFEAN